MHLRKGTIKHQCKAREKSKENVNSGTALTTVSSKKPGAKTGSRDKRKCFGKHGKCWNCGDKGHKCNACLKTKQENNSSSEGKGQQSSNSDKGKGNTSGSKSAAASSSQNTSVNAAVNKDDINGAWAAVGSSLEHTGDLYKFLAKVQEDGMPDLEAITTSDGEKNSSAVGSYCRSEAEPPHKIDNNHRPSTGAPTIDISGRLWGQEVEVYVAKTGQYFTLPPLSYKTPIGLPDSYRIPTKV